jgi:4-hydroxy-tetrahydrodipicolinate synthase
MEPPYVPRGVIPAVLLPFAADLSIDERAYRAHLSDVIAVEGVSAITVCAHSSEVHALSTREQKRVLEISVDEAAGRVPVICGVYADGTERAARLARQAEAGGAAALLVFPSQVWLFGAVHRPQMIVNHFCRIADATHLPLVAFNYPLATGLGYTTECLLELAAAVPSLVAIKDWCNNPVQHERNIRLLHAAGRPFSVLSTHSAWLMASLAMGADGLLSGAGSVIAELQSRLWAAVRDGDLAAARGANDRIWPIASAFYADPFLDMHNRMKEALVLLGKLGEAHVRPPLLKLPEAEIRRIREALARGGLLPP